MSRVSLLEKLYAKKNNPIDALEFHYESLWAPPIRGLLSQEDLYDLSDIATSVRLSGNIDRKYELIDTIMKRKGFRFDHRGTNRATYRYLENPTFLAKVAVDKVGMQDSPAEFKNQDYLKPFCCKIFEVDPSGVVAFVERVNPITSLEEFASVADDVFNMMVTKIIGKYVVDDMGTTKFMNYGIRMNNGVSFGPVVIDFPYVYALDGAKLMCKNVDAKSGRICFGEIDYDDGLNNLVCTKCGRVYTARELKKDDTNTIKMYGADSERRFAMRTRIIDKDGNVLADSGHASSKKVTADQIEQLSFVKNTQEVTRVSKTIVDKRTHDTPLRTNRKMFEQQRSQYLKTIEDQRVQEDFNPVIKKSEESKVMAAIDYNQTYESMPEPGTFRHYPTHTTTTSTVNNEPKIEPEKEEESEVEANEAITEEEAIHQIIPELDNPEIEELPEEVAEEESSEDEFSNPMDEYFEAKRQEMASAAEESVEQEDNIEDEEEEDEYSEYEDYADNFKERRSKPKGGKKFKFTEDMSDF